MPGRDDGCTRPQPAGRLDEVAVSRDRFGTWLVERLAAHHDVEPTDLDVSLYDWIDPEALDRLFATGPDDGMPGELAVTFSVEDVDVTVSRTDTGEVTLRVRDGEAADCT